MKKYFSIFCIIIISSLFLVSCGKGEKSMKLTIRNAGNIEEMSAAEFIDFHNNDAINFVEGNYVYSYIYGTGNITSIQYGVPTDFDDYDEDDYYSYCTVTVENEIDIVTHRDYLPECKVGDSVTFDIKFYFIKDRIILFDSENSTPFSVN